MASSDPVIDVTVRLSDAIYGVTITVQRNGKRLQVKIPAGARRVRLTNALLITDGVPGHLVIRVNVAAIPVPNPIQGTDLDSLFQICLSSIGGEQNRDVQNYIASRSNQIDRALFFEKAVRAIWLSGMSRKAARGFLMKVQARGFAFDYVTFGAYNAQQLGSFMQKMHGQVVRGRAVLKWQAVHQIAQWLLGFGSDAAFQASVFAGKQRGAQLDNNDIQNLAAQRLPFIGKANANYIVRHLGGEAIKEDRWTKEFQRWANLTFQQLQDQLRSLAIPLGLFDIVIWAYCERFVVRTASLAAHFNGQFGYLK